MKRRQRYTLAVAAAMVGLTVGCASNRKVNEGVTVSPSAAVLTADSSGQTQMDLHFRIPARYLSQRNRLVILPQLVVDDRVKEEYPPVVLDAPVYGKKTERRKVLEAYADPYAERAVAVERPSVAFEIPYRQTVQLPADVDSACIVGVVTTDGCGECSATDTIALASVRRPAAPVVAEPEPDPEPELVWIEPQFVERPKVVEGKGEANLQFGINKHDIDSTLGNNREELEQMVQTLAPILNDTLATLTSFCVYGVASADGPLTLNTALARRRAEAAVDWLAGRLNLQPEVRRIITVGSRPEGWQPVLDAMEADGHPGAAAVKAILERYADSNDDVQERYIRRLPCWNAIRDKYLQKARKVEYVYSYTVKSYSNNKR